MAAINEATNPGNGTIRVSVYDGALDANDKPTGNPVIGAQISLYRGNTNRQYRNRFFKSDRWSPEQAPYSSKITGSDGYVKFENVPSNYNYVITYNHYPTCEPICIWVEPNVVEEKHFDINLRAECDENYQNVEGEPITTLPRINDSVLVVAKFDKYAKDVDKLNMEVSSNDFIILHPEQLFTAVSVLKRAGQQQVDLIILLPYRPLGSDNTEIPGDAELHLTCEYMALDHAPKPLGGKIDVRLLRSRAPANNTFALWTSIRNRTKAISFSGSGYKSFIDRVLCQNIALPPDKQSTLLNRQINELGSHVYGVAAYDLLKTATEVFLLLECGLKIEKKGAHDSPEDRDILDLNYESKAWDQTVDIDSLNGKLSEYLGGKALPYIERVIAAAFPGWQRSTPGGTGNRFCEYVLTNRVEEPCFLELIWNYWHEEGMLVQSINAISRRFQNIRAPGGRDPLAHLELDPLRPLNNILWGYVEDERNRLSIQRRVSEYLHEYGCNLYGKAIPEMRVADNRSKFLEAFHNLLHLASEYFKAVQDTTVVPDGYPLLHALREVHLILAQGAHNQFGDLPWTARVEMLMQQWIMARPEIRDFLQSRAMVPYREGWMPQVDTMKTLQGWSDVTVTHFRDLGTYGEQILLSIRYHNWNDINDEDESKGWADYWRPEIQGYLHAYRAVTGVDLSNPDTVDYTMPSVHLRKRLALQQRVR